MRSDKRQAKSEGLWLKEGKPFLCDVLYISQFSNFSAVAFLAQLSAQRVALTFIHIRRYLRWTTLSDTLQSARVSTELSLSQRGRPDLTGARALPQRGGQSQDGAGVRWEGVQAALAQSLRILVVWILLRLQVRKPNIQFGRKTNKLTAAAAAKINAQIQAKKGIQHVDVPPILSPSGPATKSASPGAPSGGNSASTVNGEMYIADGDYIRDIEVNDLRNRYTLTKGSTQKMVNTPCVAFH